MKKSILPLLFIFAPLILSCWNDSSPTSDKAESYRIRGIVADKAGTGIESVTVQVTGTDFSSSDTTGSGGVFSFNSVKAGSYKIIARKDSFFFKPESVDVSVSKTDIDTLKFISADNYIHGRVLDIVTGEGIEGVRITLFQKKEIGLHKISSTVTDQDGCFGFYDLEKSAYRYSYYPNYYPWNSGSFSFEEAAFANREIILKDFYLSSENLPITKAEFLKDTNTLNLEWKPSESEYTTGYFIRILKNQDDLKYPQTYIPIGTYYAAGDNKDSRKITRNEVMLLFDQDIISSEVYLGITAIYHVGTYTYYSPCSDLIKIRLYW